MGLRAKFNGAMLVGFIVGLGLAAAFSYTIVRENAVREVTQDARIMMQSALAIRSYTSREIEPLLAADSRIVFLPQTVPSFAAQFTFRRLQASFSDYAYREPTLNPTNPEDAPVAWEAAMIDDFAKKPDLKEMISERQTPDGPNLELAHPFRLTDASCLTCHSVPGAAPAAMIDIYGPKHGFGWRLGDVIGMQVVTVPMQVALDRANRVFMLFLAGLSGIFLVMLLIVNMLLHAFIIRPVRRISAMASEVSLGKLDVPEYVPSGKDEIASLGASFNRMRRSLTNAMAMLEAD